MDPAKEIAWKNFKASMMYLGLLFASVIVDMMLKDVVLWSMPRLKSRQEEIK